MRKQGNSWQSQDVATWTFKERDEVKKVKRENNVARNVEQNARKNVKIGAEKSVGKNAMQIIQKGNGVIPI